jgi:hypothetical protein
VIEVRCAVVALDGKVGVPEGLVYILRPSIGGREELRTEKADGIAESRNVNDERAVAFTGGG